jgi:hypothetical protein
MPKFRKRPVVIEAFQWTGSNAFDLGSWAVTFGALGGPGGIRSIVENPESIVYKHVKIETLEGEMFASPGDWLIVGVKGEVYACKPDIFEITYDSVEEEPTC